MIVFYTSMAYSLNTAPFLLAWRIKYSYTTAKSSSMVTNMLVDYARGGQENPRELSHALFNHDSIIFNL